MLKVEDYLGILFDPTEVTCFAKDSHGVHVPSTAAIEVVSNQFQFLSINPLHPSKDFEPTKSWHRPDKPRRDDENVVAFRNFLIECDKLPLEEQQSYIDSLGMPYSAKVYSGGKSYHFIISLEHSLQSREAYDALVKKLHRIVAKADHTTKNPSRLSRYPNYFRSEKGKMQELLEVKGRVPNQLFIDWLDTNDKTVEAPSKQVKVPLVPGAGTESLNGFTKNFLMFGAEDGNRNNSIFRAACNCRDVGISFENAVDILSPALSNMNDFSEHEFTQTVFSAYSRKT